MYRTYLKLNNVVAMVIFLLAICIPVIPVRAESANLIANPSVETANGATPAQWTASRWGTNTATLSYPNNGNTGSKSVQIDMTAYTNGDAKWMHDAITVSPNTSYTYTSYYKATVGTEIDIQYTDASGGVSYAFMSLVPANSNWTLLEKEFVTPATAVKAVIMHNVAAVGILQTDDFSVSLTTPPATAPPVTEPPVTEPPVTEPPVTEPPVTKPPVNETNLIANPSVETANGATPAQWTASRWGTNTATLSYPNNGNTGSKSVQIDMTAYTNGDAKWMHDAITVSPNTSYTYTSYYKATVGTEIDIQYTDASGGVSYAFVQLVPASASWQPLTVSFTTPANATKAVVMHIIAQTGSLQTDDFSLPLTTPPTTEPPVTEPPITEPPVTEPPVTEPPVTEPPVDQENLFANNSLETANGSVPALWNSNAWGTNTAAFTYSTTSHTGSRSVTTTVSAYTNGDAKWYPQPVAVVAGKNYIYRDYYTSSTATRVVAAVINSTGGYSYIELPIAPASGAEWALYEATITVPATAVQLTVFHVLDSVGYLTIDDVLLQVAAPSATSIIPNGSVETPATTSAPLGWQQSSWGTNTPTYTYVNNDARTGNHSIKVTLQNYQSGDAKWFFDPITTLAAGQQYRFTTWYKTNAINPKVVALYIDQNGTEQYVGLPNPIPNGSASWQQYSDTFTVPAGTVAVSVFMFITENAWLQTDDYSITDYYPNGFDRALLSLTFDDGHEDNITTALPLMNSYGFKSTQCYATTFIEGNASAISNVLAFYNSGHEICSHTVTHPFLTQISAADVDYELAHSKQYLESIIGTSVLNFASPYGDYNESVLGQIRSNYYQSHRTVDEGFNSKDNLDVYRLRVQNVLDTTTASQVQQWVEQAQADNTWLILVYHRVANDPGPYDSYISDFEAQLAAIAQSGITVKTYQDALTEVLSQL